MVQAHRKVFGVTDVYFLAGYFGLMEVVVDEIQRLTYHKASLTVPDCVGPGVEPGLQAHTKKGSTIDCEVIIKVWALMWLSRWWRQDYWGCWVLLSHVFRNSPFTVSRGLSSPLVH